MIFHDIPADILIIRVKRAGNADVTLEEQAVFSVEASSSRPDAFEVRLRDSVVFMRPVAATDVHRLNAELASGRALLAQLANPAADGSIELQVAFFTGECLDMGEVDIGVDEYVENAVARIERSKKPLRDEHLHNRLNQRCCFQQGDNVFFFLTAGPAIDKEVEPTQKDDLATEGSDELGDSGEVDEPVTVFGHVTRTSKTEPTRKNSFCVTGDGIRFVATETDLPDSKSIFLVSSLTKRHNESDRALRLAKGKLCFVDWTQAGQVQILAKAQMTALTQDDGSYLKKWDEFGDLEGELLLKHARDVGALQYSDMEQKRGGTVCVLISQVSDSALSALANGRVPEVEVVDEPPDYVKDETLTFKQFVEGIEKTAKADKGESGRRDKKTYLKVSEFDKETSTLTLDTENLPKESGTLVLSLAGEITQIKRRIAARQAILEGRAANPQLGLLIEENGRIAPTRLPQKVQPLTAFVREKIFRNPPTVMQEKAIEIALNTPDIALIQGPPGTGKTTVIAAILERLNEMADKRGASVKGQVLLTGFQHDAVENMIERLSLNSIPVPKFGKRSGVTDDDFSVFERALEDWCAKLAVELRERNPQILEMEQEAEIKNLCLQYIQAPTRALAAHLAGKMASLGVSILGEDGARQAANLANALLREENLNQDSNQWLDATRRLRIRRESFADDGPERAVDALDDLRDALAKVEHDLLDKASLWRREDGTPPFLNELAALKKKLLARFAAPPVFRVEKQNDEVIALAELSISRIKAAGYSAKDRKSAALAEFLAELESNPYGMMSAVSDYSFAFAATCQQSVNRGMQKQKGITGRDVNENQKGMEYEFVIVDEAARVSPRDLMVAMAQGKRIILVGDHRQLPHIIDDEVASQMERGETGQDEADWLKKSMFQYLFATRLKMLEEGDGIIRRVTLDRQYRMHPQLGDFISRNFYERFDQTEKFGSGRPASDFAHKLPSTDGKAAVWIDVPAQKGNYQRPAGTTSWTRHAEAVVIAQQVKQWMNSAEGLCSSLGFSERDDFVDILSFASKLKKKDRPFDKWFSQQLSPELQIALANNNDLTSLEKSLVDAVNDVLKQPLIYEKSRFEGIELRPEIVRLLSLPHEMDGLACLNRLLIEDAYPLEVKRRPNTFGVISFYKAQAELIDKLLGNITDDDKKLRIGTVDSFQGMEFDVVLLSMVRTLPQNWKPKDGDREKQARELFGHLCLYNRLNVSMSRQKKLLVVVGDSGLLQSDLAAEFVPGLVDFIKLCRKQGVVLPC